MLKMLKKISNDYTSGLRELKSDFKSKMNQQASEFRQLSSEIILKIRDVLLKITTSE